MGDVRNKANCFVYSSCSDKCNSCGKTKDKATPITTIQCTINLDVNCTECKRFCIYTPGGCTSTCSGNNVWCLRDRNWNKVVGEKLIIVDPNVIPSYTIIFTSSRSVDNFKTG